MRTTKRRLEMIRQAQMPVQQAAVVAELFTEIDWLTAQAQQDNAMIEDGLAGLAQLQEENHVLRRALGDAALEFADIEASTCDTHSGDDARAARRVIGDVLKTKETR